MPRASIVSPFAGALLLGIPASSFAQSRTAVSVETRIMVPRFRDQFGSEVDSVERNVARHFRRTLAKEVGFLDFAVNDTTARYRLLFIFDVRERDVVSPFPEFGFRVRLEEPDSTHVERYWLTMRACDRATAGVGSPEASLVALGV